MLGGIPLELDYLKELDNFAKENDAFIHTDGARLINAAISLNIPLDEICQYTDTVRDQRFGYSKAVRYSLYLLALHNGNLSWVHRHSVVNICYGPCEKF